MLPTLSLLSLSDAHGSMVWPPTWFQPNGTDALEPFNQCGGKSSCLWFTNWTHVEERKMEANSPMRTYGYSDPTYQLFGEMPWAYPGSAYVNSPCGTFGGNPKGCPEGTDSPGDQCYGGGFSNGPDALYAYGKKNSELSDPFNYYDIGLTDILKTKVQAGAALDVNWVPQANHGGGYSYRLCKVPADGDMTKLTEESFQKNTLDYASDYSWIQWGTNKEDSVKFKATRSSNGTYPKGSVWTRDPIPACGSPDGGVFSESGNNCDNAGATQFDPPVPGVQGFGAYYTPGDFQEPINDASFPYTVGDSLQIPEDIAPGDYVLSWRWDCEQTAQIWFTCADLEITKPKRKAPMHKRKPKNPHAYNPHGQPGRAPKPKRA